MVHVGPDDYGPRHLFVRSERGGGARRIHRCDRPQFPPAGPRARLRQQPGRAYVAGDDPAGEISVGDTQTRRRIGQTSGSAIPSLKHAAETGELLLKGRSLAIWRKALTDGPPEALDVTL